MADELAVLREQYRDALERWMSARPKDSRAWAREADRIAKEIEQVKGRDRG